MNTLAKIVSSRARSEIFRILFSLTDIELHNREIERRSGLSESNVRRELRHLESLELIRSRKDSNRVYYRANRDHPLYREIRNLVLKTSGLADILQECLDSARIKTAFIFGSVAAGEARGGSDVDLIVIGDIGLRELSGLLHRATERIGREVNPHVFSPKEFSRRLSDKDPFLKRVVVSPKIFIKGCEDDLGAMGQ